MLLLLTLPAAVQAQFTYTTNAGAITITGYTGPGGAVTVPGTTNGHPEWAANGDADGDGVSNADEKAAGPEIAELVGLAHRMGSKVTALRIETREQMDAAAELYQGA